MNRLHCPNRVPEVLDRRLVGGRNRGLSDQETKTPYVGDRAPLFDEHRDELVGEERATDTAGD